MKKKHINILLTSSGRRGYLVNYFKKALNGRGLVHAGNSAPGAPAFYYADKSVVTPLIYDENYIPFLLDYCKKNAIKAIIPLFDIDLKILSKKKDLFAHHGIVLIVSEETVINICNDKWETFQFCSRNGFLCPKTYQSEKEVLAAIESKTISFPIIVKSRWGMGSIAVYEACNEKELWFFAAKTRKEIFATYLKYESAEDVDDCVIFQEKIQGEEYGLDVIHDLSGNHVNTIVRKKIAMRSGETDSAMVVKHLELEQIGTRLGNALGHIGNLDMDVFISGDSIYVLDLNARFGGGYPFSHCAGVDLPKAIIHWVLEEPISDELIVKHYDHIMQKDIQIIDMLLGQHGGY